MLKLRLLLVLALSLLLLSRPAIRLATAEEEELDYPSPDEDEDFPEDYPDPDLHDPEGFAGDTEAEGEIPDGDDGDVVALDAESLGERVAGGKPFLLEFYAPWCGHCKSLAPAFRKAAAELKEHEVTLAKMDATKFEDVAVEYGIEGYPSLLWVVGKTIKQYTGGRTTEEIVAWVKKRVGFAITTLSSVEDAKKAQEEQQVLVAAYFKDLKGPEAAAFADSGKDADDVEYFQTDNAAVAEALGLGTSAPAAVAVIKRSDDKFVSFDGAYTADAITQFVMANKLPLFVVFNDEAAQLVFGGSIKKMIFMFFPHEEFATRTAEYSSIAREFKGKLILIYVNSSDSEMDNVREFFGVTATTTIALGFSTEKREDGEKFRMDGELTTDNLLAFCWAFSEGQAKAFFKSEPVPKKNDGPVKVVVGDSFEEIVLDSNKDVLLEVYAPWCGHCKALEPTFNMLGEKFADISSVVIAKMDGTANEHPDITIEGFPTLLFFPAYNKTPPMTVDAERRLIPLAKFIQEHASISFEAPVIKPEDEPAPAEEAEEEEEEELADEEPFPEDELAEEEEEEGEEGEEIEEVERKDEL